MRRRIRQQNRANLAAASTAAACLAALTAGGVLGGCSQPLLVFRGDSGGTEVVPASPVAAVPAPADPGVTGSIERRPASFGSDLSGEDWRRARAALTVALDPQGNGRPVKWDNPETGLYGSVNPTGLPYVAEDAVCRNFLASVIGPGRSRFVRGTGCRPSGGEWTLKRVHGAPAPVKPTT